VRRTIASWALIAFGLMGQQLRAQTAAPSLDFEFFREKVQPIFVTERMDHARCIVCHGDPESNLHPHLAELTPGTLLWNEEDSRKNFAEYSKFVVPGSLKSPLLVHPLAPEAGGDPDHLGGKQFKSQDDPDWQILKAWVMGAKMPPSAGATKARIIQTNFASNYIDIIDPANDKIVGQIKGIELNHGVAVSPDGNRIFISDETNISLDVADGRTFQLTNRIPLSEHPNNIYIGRDGRFVYVSIAGGKGGVDVIDAKTLQRVKTIPTNMSIHNTYVTPDGKYALAGSIRGKAVTVIDTETNEVAWTIPMDLGIRPMAMSANLDGSTKWLFLQLTAYNGFAVIDFATHKEINRIKIPDLPPGKKGYPPGNEVSHGMFVTPDQKTLLVVSRINSALYFYSLPDLKVVGMADLEGKGSGWMTLSPDGSRAYIANAVTDDVSVVDVKTMKEVDRIPVGFTPKRNITAMLP
jgi:YVTN family beta-propeller protein